LRVRWDSRTRKPSLRRIYWTLGRIERRKHFETGGVIGAQIEPSVVLLRTSAFTVDLKTELVRVEIARNLVVRYDNGNVVYGIELHLISCP
jgi:hypothetical protein